MESVSKKRVRSIRCTDREWDELWAWAAERFGMTTGEFVRYATNFVVDRIESLSRTKDECCRIGKGNR